jgi:hypothetical protein
MGESQGHAAKFKPGKNLRFIVFVGGVARASAGIWTARFFDQYTDRPCAMF